MWKWIPIAILTLIVAVLVVAFGTYRSASADAEAAMADVQARARPAAGNFDLAMVASLPEIAQRYFAHAIAPGAPLNTAVRLEMQGIFLLGDAKRYQTFSMRARQVLVPPSEFVWIPEMTSGLMQISGSDGLAGGAGWTRFWINALVPVVSQRTSPDVVRSASTRSAMEAVWVPASLLPGNGATWEQIGPDTARLSFDTGVEPVDIVLDKTGRVLEIITMRWSDVNPEKTFQLQPFGGTVEAEATFEGFTIPSQLKIGNHYGTDDYLPFFQATVTSVEYL